MNENTATIKTGRSAGLMPSIVGASLVVALLVLWGSYGYFTQRFTENLRSQAQTRAALYAGNIKSTLQKHSVVPFLLAQDLTLSAALLSSTYTPTSQRLIEISEEIGAASVFLLDISGHVVASSNRRQIGKFFRAEPYFINALRNSGTVFSTTSNEQNTYRFFFSQKVKSGPKSIGVVVVRLTYVSRNRSGASLNCWWPSSIHKAKSSYRLSFHGGANPSNPLWKRRRFRRLGGYSTPSSKTR